MEILRNSFGITPSPALEKLCEILETYDEKVIHRCRHHSHSFVQLVTKISEIKDFKSRIYILDLAHKDHIKIIENAKFSDEVRNFLLNIVAKLYREKKNEWSKAKVKIVANRQREFQLLKNKTNKQ